MNSQYPLLGTVSDDDRKETVFIYWAIALFLIFGGGLFLALYPSHLRIKKEKEFLWTVAYTDPRISSQIGGVRNADIQRVSGRRRSRDAIERKVTGNVVEGFIRFSVYGKTGYGAATIHYRWNHSSGDHIVTSIDFSPTRYSWK